MIIMFERPDRFGPFKDIFFHSVGNRMLNTILNDPKRYGRSNVMGIRPT
jgi:hypothetical protein